ncbi:hypothetical protein EYF80_061565 [Liparis tanakae]|uniref:Uncharacterized protein n=1 Tax=Liparis tanakae TaxID=230148 RepID=A0A4Z2EHK2_9TELE|nr:hypothetical protein EYF80_061565 [Liparis tanakae]
MTRRRRRRRRGLRPGDRAPAAGGPGSCCRGTGLLLPGDRAPAAGGRGSCCRGTGLRVAAVCTAAVDF